MVSTTSKPLKPLFILFYMNGCGHCELFMNSPEWDKIKKRKGLVSVQMEAGESSIGESNFIRGEEYMAHKHKLPVIEAHKTNNVRGYPTLAKLVGDEVIEYNGERKAKDILEWLFPKKVGAFGAIGGKRDKTLKSKALKYLPHTGGASKTRKSCCWDFFEF
jgi:hypothetical protein